MAEKVAPNVKVPFLLRVVDLTIVFEVYVGSKTKVLITGNRTYQRYFKATLAIGKASS